MDQTRQCSILLVEDETLLAIDMEVILSRAGFRVIGPAPTLEAALAHIRDETPDITILDLNLGRQMVFPAADTLADAGLPFIILSGHSHEVVPPRHRDRYFVAKPYNPETLLRTVQQALEDSGARCATHALTQPAAHASLH